MQYVLKLNGSGEGQSLTANSLQTPDREDGLMDTFVLFSHFILLQTSGCYIKKEKDKDKEESTTGNQARDQSVPCNHLSSKWHLTCCENMQL